MCDSGPDPVLSPQPSACCRACCSSQSSSSLFGLGGGGHAGGWGSSFYRHIACRHIACRSGARKIDAAEGPGQGPGAASVGQLAASPHCPLCRETPLLKTAPEGRCFIGCAATCQPLGLGYHFRARSAVLRLHCTSRPYCFVDLRAPTAINTSLHF